MADLPLDQLRTLLAVVDTGTLDAAARELMITPSAVSQRLKALEGAAGRVLVQRTRPVRPTESGERLLRLARQMILLADESGRWLADRDGPGTERVSIPVVINGDSLHTWALAALAAVPAELGICFDVHREDEATSTRLLRSGTVMAAITSVAEPVQGCSVRRLGRMRYRPMCSPAFRDRWFADGPTVDALAVAPLVAFDRVDRLQDRYLARRTRRRIDPPRHHIPTSADFAEAVALGLGWGMLPHQQSGPYEAAGRLVVFDPDVRLDDALYWQQWKLHTPALDAVADAVVRAAAVALR